MHYDWTYFIFSVELNYYDVKKTIRWPEDISYSITVCNLVNSGRSGINAENYVLILPVKYI